MSTYAQATGKSIEKSFEEFNAAHPEVYDQFVKFALMLIRQGYKKLSAKLIIERVRWEMSFVIPKTDLYNKEGDKIEFKINNVFVSYYARKFVSEPHFKKYERFFEFRRLTNSGSTAPITA